MKRATEEENNGTKSLTGPLNGVSVSTECNENATVSEGQNNEVSVLNGQDNGAKSSTGAQDGVSVSKYLTMCNSVSKVKCRCIEGT